MNPNTSAGIPALIFLRKDKNNTLLGELEVTPEMRHFQRQKSLWLGEKRDWLGAAAFLTIPRGSVRLPNPTQFLHFLALQCYIGMGSCFVSPWIFYSKRSHFSLQNVRLPAPHFCLENCWSISCQLASILLLEALSPSHSTLPTHFPGRNGIQAQSSAFPIIPFILCTNTGIMELIQSHWRLSLASWFRS